MALLDDKSLAAAVVQRAGFRLTAVATKLNRREHDAFRSLAKKRGRKSADLLRQLILDELARDTGEMPAGDPSLAEILGVRLLLVNVLRPIAAGQTITPETFDQILDQIGHAKHQLAKKMLAEREGK